MSNSATTTAKNPSSGLLGLFSKLHSIQIGGAKNGAQKIKRPELVYMIRNIATLVDNGVALPKALATLSKEKTLQKYADLFEAIRRKVEAGETFSSAVARYPETFTDVIVNQIRIGERSGTMPAMLTQITEQLENSDNLRRRVMKKLAYPIMLTVIGSMAVVFMLIFVIPIFQETYASSGVPLPFITRFLIGAGEFMTNYGWGLGLFGVFSIFTIRYLRKNPDYACAMDRTLLRVPILGEWLRNIAVLQFMEVLGNMLEAGFTMVDALRISSGSVSNHAVKRSITELHSAVMRGERFSRELGRLGDLFPPVVSQLMIVGEQTGTVAKATADVRKHLRREIERTTNAMVGTIEPVLTISLAAMIGSILLAIYLPMFDMIGAMNPQ